MPTIVISPYSKPLRNGNPNPKNYPFFSDVVTSLVQKGYEVIQVGVAGEAILPGVSSTVFNAPLSQLQELVQTSSLWISIDNFFPHFAAVVCKKFGIVLWGKSDPNIFGHPENLNLLKSREYLKERQWEWWESEPYTADAFVVPETVVNAVTEAVPYAYTK